jgi:hypothetical protein
MFGVNLKNTVKWKLSSPGVTNRDIRRSLSEMNLHQVQVRTGRVVDIIEVYVNDGRA